MITDQGVLFFVFFLFVRSCLSVHACMRSRIVYFFFFVWLHFYSGGDKYAVSATIGHTNAQTPTKENSKWITKSHWFVYADKHTHAPCLLPCVGSLQSILKNNLSSSINLIYVLSHMPIEQVDTCSISELCERIWGEIGRERMKDRKKTLFVSWKNNNDDDDSNTTN